MTEKKSGPLRKCLMTSYWRGATWAIAFALLSQAAMGQGITVGVIGPRFFTFSGIGAYTVIELGYPASRSGSIASATLVWSAAPCTAAVKVKFFRPEDLGYKTTFHYIAERGPFDVLARTQSVALVPPVSLLKGDLIGITKLGTCGDAVSDGPISPVLPPRGSIQFAGDIRGDILRGPEDPGFDVMVQATDEAGLALLDGRFLATLVATNPRTRTIVMGRAVPQGDGFGYFSLPDFTADPTFPEVTVKMVDATGAPALGGGFWFFHAPLTDVQYTISVMDRTAGTVRTYSNTPGGTDQLCGGVDTSAFPGP